MSILPWWRQSGKVSQKDLLPSIIPTPGQNQGHVLPYVRAIGDDWGRIEMIAKTGGHGALYKATCAGCGIATQLAVNDTTLFDPTIYWLCETCLSTGFRWGSTLTQDEMPEYQAVRAFPNDLLWRHLKYSKNPHDSVHRPVDQVEKLARSLTKGYKPDLKPK
jgi:hypothetical protein